VSAAVSDSLQDDRMLAFEIGSSLYALPISAVVEVTEIDEAFSAVPTIPAKIGGVINFYGDALPVLASDALLGVSGAEAKSPMQIVVLTDGPHEKARLGLPVDEVLGLVSGQRAVALGADPVAERRSIDGRVAHILDPTRLLALAATVIERSGAEGD
jgi:chemotaxis signal transduction protein